MMRYLRILFITGLLLGAAGIAAAAVVVGAYYYLLPGLPDARELREVRLQVPLSVYSRDGRLIAQMGEKRRDPVPLEDMPPRLIQAFLAAEDERFYSHPGFDLQGIARAALGWATTGSVSRGGGSTITQQLAKITFLTPEQTVVRKAREIFLARRIEQQLTKDEILELYLNKIFLGQRAFGVSAAAQVFFGKSLNELDLAEIATIAGLPQAPSLYNPVRSPELATARRGYVLRRMLEAGFITREEHDRAREQPMLSRLHGPRIELEAPHVAEMVRAQMLQRYGPAVYEAGFRVVTTIDSRLQAAANHALRQTLLEYDRRHGWRGPLVRLGEQVLIPPAGVPPGQHYHRLLADYPEPAVLRVGVVTTTGEQHAEVHLREHGVVNVPWSGLSWARRHIRTDALGPAPQQAEEIVRPGDVVYLVRVADGGWTLTQLPQVQGALVAMDPADGAITALIGGFDYFVSKFNRATQARRQPGSAFKPFVFSAALEHGYTAASIVNDAPLVFESSELEQAWRPENYSRQWHGPTRMREALVRSLNLVSVRILLGAGVANTVSHLQSFGLSDSALPRNPTLALGAGSMTPLELTAGYAAFANGGYRVEPYFIDQIEDGSGRLVFQSEPAVADCFSCVDGQPATLPALAPVPLATRPDATVMPRAADGQSMPLREPRLVTLEPIAGVTAHGEPVRRRAERVISPQNAWIIGDMMVDVIRRGTGQRARRELGRDDIAGKTGTSNDRRDAWFAGYNGDLVATAWVGFDQERSLGLREEGGRTALPMWNYFMAEALAGVPAHRPQRPPDLVEVRISPTTGLLAPAGAPGTIFEVFHAERVPAAQGGSNGERPERRRDEYDDSTLF